MKRLIASIIAPFFVFFLTTTAFAQQSPVKFMEGISTKIVHVLKKKQSKLKTHPHIVPGLVKKYLVPNVDLTRMSGSVVGRKYWTSATAQQKKQFIGEFAKLVITTYSSALASFDNDIIRFRPYRGNYKKRRAVQVNSVIIRQTGQRIPVSYNLEKANGSWEIYDFTIENVSMLQSYRSQFASTLAQGGLPRLLKRLKRHNARS